MTFKKQIEAIFEHPFFESAINKFITGDDSDLRHLFHELQFHVYDKATLNASINYGKHRWLNSCDVKKEIRNTPPPDNLDLSMQIPVKKTILNTAKFVDQKQSRRIGEIIVPNQLNLFIQVAIINSQ